MIFLIFGHWDMLNYLNSHNISTPFIPLLNLPLYTLPHHSMFWISRLVLLRAIFKLIYILSPEIITFICYVIVPIPPIAPKLSLMEWPPELEEIVLPLRLLRRVVLNTKVT